MSLRNKLTRVLAEQGVSILSDPEDAQAVLDALMAALSPNPLELNQACEALRWHLNTGCGVSQKVAETILSALGEA